MTVQNVYDTFCDRVLEHGGLQLGLVTDAQLLNYFQDVLNDFCRQTGLAKVFVTQQITSGTADYVNPPVLIRTEAVFVNTFFAPRTNMETLDNSVYNWRTKSGDAYTWHEDGLAINTVELVNKPNWNGQPVFSGYSYISGASLGAAGFFSGNRNLTCYGSQMPDPKTYSLGDTIPLLPDSAVLYIGFGILAAVLASDTELKDLQKASYCSARFSEGVSLFRAVLAEELEEEFE